MYKNKSWGGRGYTSIWGGVELAGIGESGIKWLLKTTASC